MNVRLMTFTTFRELMDSHTCMELQKILLVCPILTKFFRGHDGQSAVGLGGTITMYFQWAL